ncbi:MAG TPA: hypothetical protein DHV26_17265 [Cytophagales bacterium]|nr:hypothetical protein [Cytophagales bacterium]
MKAPVLVFRLQVQRMVLPINFETMPMIQLLELLLPELVVLLPFQQECLLQQLLLMFSLQTELVQLNLPIR